jgi:hypothetical protein
LPVFLGNLDRNGK